MSLNFEGLNDNDIINLEDHQNAIELSEDMIFPSELYDLGLKGYEPNELVLKAVRDLRLFFENESNCSCRKFKNKICFEKIGFNNFLERQLQLKGLDKKELDLCVKSQLMVFKSSETERYEYQYNSSIPICQPVYLKLCGIGKTKFFDLQKHLKTDDLMDRIHGNTKNIPQNKSRAIVNIEIAQLVKDFLLQYTNVHGLPSPMKIRDNLEEII